MATTVSAIDNFKTELGSLINQFNNISSHQKSSKLLQSLELGSPKVRSSWVAFRNRFYHNLTTKRSQLISIYGGFVDATISSAISELDKLIAILKTPPFPASIGSDLVTWKNMYIVPLK